MDRPPRHHEHAFALMMDGPWALAGRVHPGPHDFEDEKVVAVDELPIHDLAFQAGTTFGDEGSRLQIDQL